MQLFNKILLTLAIVGVQQAQASLAQATAPQAPEGNLAQVTGQAQDRSAVQIVPTDKPSQVLLGVVQIGDVHCKMAAHFTSAEIDKYPDYKDRFGAHAAAHLESSNSQDVAAIVHLIYAYPDIAGSLAVEAVNRTGAISQDIRDALANSERPAPITVSGAVSAAKNATVWGLGWSLLAVLQAEGNRKKILGAAEKALGANMVAGRPADRLVHALRNKRESLNADVSAQQKGILGQFCNDLPRTVTVAVGTAALTTVILREFDERVALKAPEYDPKSDNTKFFSYQVANLVVRNVALPYVLSYVLGYTYDAVASAINGN